MNERPELARIATEALAKETVKDEQPSPAARADAIAAIAAALDARMRNARRRRILGGVGLGLAAAAAVMFAVRARRPAPALGLEGTAQVVHAGTSVASPSALSPGDRVVASNGGTVVLATGTRLVLDGESDLSVASAGKNSIFDVRSGSVRFEVAKLASDDRFVVRTSDAEVEVRGTVFTVAVVPPDARCGATVTRVAVREGVVVVRNGENEVKLVAGDTWPRCDVAATPATTATTVSAPTTTSSAKPLPATDLAAQNDTFAEGIAKKRSGDREGAIATFDRLLARWPYSTLAEHAAAERMHLASGPRAVSYAKAYLTRFPNGYAAKDARALVSAP